MGVGWNKAKQSVIITFDKEGKLMDYCPVCPVFFVEGVCHLIFIHKGAYEFAFVDQMDGMWRLIGFALELCVGLVRCQESLEDKGEIHHHQDPEAEHSQFFSSEFKIGDRMLHFILTRGSATASRISDIRIPARTRTSLIIMLVSTR